MRITLFSLLAAFFLFARAAEAQEAVFIQVEAQPSLARIEESLRDYAEEFPDVNGFALAAGWYGVALGPYSREEAQARLRQLRANRQIPRDSYLQDADRYGQRIWPVGAGPVRTAEIGNDTSATQAGSAQPEENSQAAPEPVDETPREARASENRLDREQKKDLQVALKWAGFYDGPIDAAFGRGTRGAMAGWQRENGYEETGVLTTRQRAELFRQYNAVLDGMDIQTVRETRAGISIDLPLGAVAFDRYDSPFVHFEETGKVEGAKVLLISQPGDRDRLYGLYEIMQTLEIVPLDGPRERLRNGFTLTGANDRIVSHTEASLSDGAIKGFTLVWPAGDEERRSRILARMKESFSAIGGVLDPAVVADDTQRVDLVAGLQIRQPKTTASGFFVDPRGRVVTTRDAVMSCTRLTLNDRYEAEIVAEDANSGIAVLRPTQTLAPSSVASFRNGVPRLQSEVAVAGYSFGGVLTTPTLTFGTLEDLRGLSGEENLKRLAMSTLPGDAGGPVLDSGGAVLGMLLPRAEDGRVLPEEVSFAARLDALRGVLSRAGVDIDMTEPGPDLDPVDLTRIAVEMTVLVSCWD